MNTTWKQLLSSLIAVTPVIAIGCTHMGWCAPGCGPCANTCESPACESSCTTECQSDCQQCGGCGNAGFCGNMKSKMFGWMHTRSLSIPDTLPLGHAPGVELWVASSRGFLPEFDSLLPAQRRLALGFASAHSGGNVALLKSLPALGAWLKHVDADWLHAHYLTSHGTLAWLAKRLWRLRGQLVGSAWGSDILLTPQSSLVYRAVTRRVFNRVKEGAATPQPSKLDRLSAQERRVLEWVAQGKTNKEIAAAMTLSDKTVKNYLSNLMEKLQMSRRSQAAAFYVQHSGS